MADTAEQELNSEPKSEPGKLSTPAKVTAFVVFPILAVGSIVLDEQDSPQPFVPRAQRDVTSQAPHSPTTFTPPATARREVIKTPWQEALESGSGWTSTQLDPAEVPTIARQAYDRATARLAVRAPRCRVDWALLAAIGQIESDHGRHGGSSLRQDGTTSMPIRGVPLNGEGVALIHDTDGGTLDGDAVFDRAMGPMQFLPVTWQEVGADGNDDGLTAPDNIFDAALAAAGYLCGGGGDLTLPADAAAAVHRYNNSDSYVSAVLGLAARLRSTPAS